MLSFIFNSTLFDALTRAIDFRSDKFGVMLVTAAPGKRHRRRSDVTAEVAETVTIDGEAIATGYKNGGLPVSVQVEQLESGAARLILGAALWSYSTIGATGAVYFKSRGGPPKNDELVAYIDFEGEIKSKNGPFTVDASTVHFPN